MDEPGAEDGAKTRRLVLLLAVVCEGGLGVLAWGLGWLSGRPPLAALHWRPADLGYGVAVTVPMLLVFLLLVHYPVGPAAGIRHFCDRVVRPLFAPCTLADLAVVSLLAGLGEELLFRGLVQPALAAWLGPWPALLGAALLFGLAHPITPAYVAFATLVGVYLGYAFMLTDNLLVVIVAHALYDFLALAYLVRVLPPRQPVSL